MSRALDLHSSVEKMLKATETHLDFTRIPAEFEPYYLGVESREKHCLIDFEEASEDVIRIFEDEDTRLTKLGDGISSFLKDELGSRITGRTNLMVRQTFSSEEEEKSFRATEDWEMVRLHVSRFLRLILLFFGGSFFVLLFYRRSRFVSD